MNLGERVRKIRMKRGLSITQLARESGVDHSLISMLERGKLDNPTLKTLKKLAKVLGVSLDYLAGMWEEES